MAKYWGEEQDAALRLWQMADPAERNRIYTQLIHGPLSRLATGVMTKFPDIRGDRDIAGDLIGELYRVLPRIDYDRKSTAFSYLTMTAQHWCIHLLQQRKLRLHRERSWEVSNRPAGMGIADDAEHDWTSFVSDLDLLPETPEEAISAPEELSSSLRHVTAGIERWAAQPFSSAARRAVAEALLLLFQSPGLSPVDDHVFRSGRRQLRDAICTMTGLAPDAVRNQLGALRRWLEDHPALEGDERPPERLGDPEDVPTSGPLADPPDPAATHVGPPIMDVPRVPGRRGPTATSARVHRLFRSPENVHGLTFHAIRARIDHRGASDAEALLSTAEFRNLRRRARPARTNRWRDLAASADNVHGLPWKLIRHRVLNANLSAEEALRLPRHARKVPRRSARRLHAAALVASPANVHALDERQVVGRLKAGWDEERILSTPITRGRPRGERTDRAP